MPEAHDAKVLCPTDKILDEAGTARLRRELAPLLSSENPERIALDLHHVEDIRPRALSALLELGRKTPNGNLSIVGLSRHTTLLAVQVGLAEHFPIYVSAAAFRGVSAPSRVLRAIIYEVSSNIGVGALDIAGRPLLVRQLQFLRDCGIEDVVVEVCDGRAAVARAAALLGTDPLTSRVQLIPSESPLSAPELARRAGIPSDELFIALPADLALHGKIDLQLTAPTRYLLSAPEGIDEPSVSSLELRTAEASAAHAPILASEGWAMHTPNHERAHALSCAALAGRAPGLLIHASELQKGVWVARGARVSPDAQVVGPVLIGPDARIFAGAQIGPCVVIGQGCVVERDAHVSQASVAAHTIVGEGMYLRDAHASAHGITSFADGNHMPVTDPLLLSPRLQGAGTAPSSRLLALLLLVLLATPWLLSLSLRKLLSAFSAQDSALTDSGTPSASATERGIVSLLPALFEVVMGQRDLVGINDPRVFAVAPQEGLEPLRRGAFDVSAALAPGASVPTLLRMWRWYQAHKSATLDRELWRQKNVSAQQET